MTTRRTVREESWDSLQRSEVSTEDGYDPDDDGEETEDPQLMTIGDVHRALHPLQATADRVGKQAEQFAESLDRLSPRNTGKRDASTADILPLVHEYERIAAETVKRLKRSHEPARQEMLQKSFRRRLRKERGTSTPTDFYQEEPSNPSSTTVADLDHWEQERQTWQLLGFVIQAQSPAESKANDSVPSIFTPPRNIPKPHRYSSEYDVWNYYLEHNPDMWEKHVIVEWLKLNANSMGQDIDTIVEQLESDEERGSDLWAHGWMYSKEDIKSQKRLRSWPEPIDPSSSIVKNAITASEGSTNLVTQLDPDACSRQDRNLAKEDMFFERATWLACWEMIRRGYSWESVRVWCEERVELWRSLSMRGDPRPAYHGENAAQASASRSRMLWRTMCMKLASDGGIDDYERAVYGVLSGDLASVQKVGRTWDDILFANYNSQLLQNFDLYVQRTLPDRLQGLKPDAWATRAAGATTGLDGPQAWKLLLEGDTTRDEARSPIKLLQGSIIAHQISDYLVAQGYALSQVLQKGDAETQRIARSFEHQNLIPTAPLQLSSYELLRMLTHVAFTLQDLGQLDANPEGIEQLVVAYVDFLGKAGKQQLLPLYASRLSPSGAIECMARQLPSIVENGERKTLLNLMRQYNMDVPAILLMQIVLVTQDRPVDPNAKFGYPPLRLLKALPNGQAGLPVIRENFLGDEILDEDWDLINGMEWYLLLDRHWKETMYAGSLVYKYLLLTGSLAAARELSRRVPFPTISLNKTEEILGTSVDLGVISEDDNSQPASPERRRRAGGKSGRKTTAPPSAVPTPAQRAALREEANTFRDLEALLAALDALETFATVAAGQAALGADARHAKSWKHELQRAADAVASTLEPLLEPGWLARPATPREGAELAALRAIYLPELVLAYIAVVGVCGQVLSREVLLRGMDLAALIAGAGDGATPATLTATPSTPPTLAHRRRKSSVAVTGVVAADPEDGGELARCFVRSGRMAELVDALAVLSRMIVQADEAGGRRGRRSGRRGGSEGLGLWSVHGR